MSFTQLFEQICAAPPGASFTVTHGHLAARAFLGSRLMAAGRSVALIAKNGEELSGLKALLQLFTDGAAASPSDASHSGGSNHAGAQELGPWVVIPPFPAGSHSRGAWGARLAGLYALHERTTYGGGPLGLITTLDSFLPGYPPSRIIAELQLKLSCGVDFAPELILDQAVDWGFLRAPLVTQPGEITRRGDILDIFPPGMTHPLRLEFFGDTLEQIRFFEPSGQRSVRNINEFTLLPTLPVIGQGAALQEAEKWWESLRFAGRLEIGQPARFAATIAQGDAALMPGVFYKDSAALNDYLPKNIIRLLPDASESRAALAETGKDWNDWLLRQAENNDLIQPEELVLRGLKEIERMDESKDSGPKVYFSSLQVGEATENISLPERRIRSFSDLFPLAADQERPWHRLITAINEWRDAGKKVLLCLPSERARDKFLKLAMQDGLSPEVNPPQSWEIPVASAAAPSQSRPSGAVYTLIAPFYQGAELPWANLIILGEDILQPKSERVARVKSSAFTGIDRYDDLKPGDFLVHRDFGIAAFGGLVRLNLNAQDADFLLLTYAGGDKLYLPVDRMSLVQRFKGPEGADPGLDKLGGAAWALGKDKAKKAIEKIAHDLVEIYARRRVGKGYAYGFINELYREFEAGFGFEETPDQLRAIQEVMNDMDKPQPMDRLVCGDVGFGKTEVALRAAFRAAAGSRQVMLLCPTTVLAEQHYNTFKTRLAGFPVNVGMLSRFVSPKEQKEVLAAAATGQIDILIGTHRLLSGDVHLPNLSLLILDEEQRFGVRHKDKLKELRHNLDVLTLTATPIPRTLQLSISGIRELSVIETAPPERKPVATALINQDKAGLRSIIARELERDGQVFWVHNRVQDIERVIAYVRELAPDARIGMAHGQMNEKALEETMHKFWRGDVDILVCTSIIESGLDFPMANTLIVDQAHMFGLGQLYQLRGRVGRSERQAYAIFVVRDVDNLSDIARERLRIILDMDYLGAGFQVAMEDLRIRGAGNILGEVQSGHMARLGLDLYLEMLEEAVSKVKGEPSREALETELSIGLPAFIPDGYISDAGQRLKYYKTLASTREGKELHDIELELRDLYGPLPPELNNFLAVLDLKRLLGKLQAVKADISGERLKLVWNESSTAVDPSRLVSWVGATNATRGAKVRLLPPAALEYGLAVDLPVPERLREAMLDLNRLLED